MYVISHGMFLFLNTACAPLPELNAWRWTSHDEVHSVSGKLMLLWVGWWWRAVSNSPRDLSGFHSGLVQWRHWAAPVAAGTGGFRLLGAMRMGEPVRGPRAVEAGSAAIPDQTREKEQSQTLKWHQRYFLCRFLQISAMSCCEQGDQKLYDTVLV